MYFRLLVASLILLGLATPAAAAEFTALLARARKELSSESMRQHIETLASDTLEGREAGKRGGRSAAAYVMDALKEAEVQPAGPDGSYFQEFNAGFRNVLGLVRGSDPELRDEYVLVAAHFDHVGYGSKSSSNGPVGFIHNGADDNASGVASVLELARTLNGCSSGLGRSLLFAFWDAEEKGLWGSKHWLANPTLSPEQIRLVINLDMVGRLRDRKLTLAGTRSLAGLRAAWSRANVTRDLRLEFPWVVLENSDHYPFFQRGTPVTMVHTGLHDDYHRPTDDVDRLNFEGIRQTTELLLNFVFSVASDTDLGRFRPESHEESSEAMRHYFERPNQARQARLGISWKQQDDGTALIRSVATGSAADRSGIRAGDIVARINGVPLHGTAMLQGTLATAGELVALHILRNSNLLEFGVRLDGDPVRIGLAWRENSAEPFSVMVSEVVPGTPAARSGLKRLDRIHRVGGSPVGEDRTFHELMLGVDQRADLLVERQGRLGIVKLDLTTGGSSEGEAEAVKTSVGGQP